MRLPEFLNELASVVIQRPERRFAGDVLRELGIRPDAVERPSAAPAKPKANGSKDTGRNRHY